MYKDMEQDYFGTVRQFLAMCDNFRHCKIFSNFRQPTPTPNSRTATASFHLRSLPPRLRYGDAPLKLFRRRIIDLPPHNYNA